MAKIRKILPSQRKRHPSKKKSDPEDLIPVEKIDPRKRLNVYVINSGRETLANRILNESIEMLKHFLVHQNLYLLSVEQSIAFLRVNPEFVGRDPLLVVLDPPRRKLRNRYGFGAIVALGQCYWALGRNKQLQLTKVQLNELISMFIRILNSHNETRSIAQEFHRVNHQAGLIGTLNVVMDSVGQEALHLAAE